MLHDEVDRRTALAATEALAYIAGTVDRKRGCALVVKRAQTLVVGSGAAKLDEVADDIDNIGRIQNPVYRLLVNPAHRISLKIKPYREGLRYTCRFYAALPVY